MSELRLEFIEKRIQQLWSKLEETKNTLSSDVIDVTSGLNDILLELQNDVDWEVLVAQDTVTGTKYQLRVVRDQSTGTVTQEYFDVSGAPFVPTNPMEIVGLSNDGLASEATLSGIATDITNIDTNIGSILTSINSILTLVQELSNNVRTPSFSRQTAAGSILAGSYSCSIMNVGGANGTVLGSSISPGESLSFNADSSNTLGVIAYDATGTELIITEVR